jgi:hypothetical protein
MLEEALLRTELRAELKLLSMEDSSLLRLEAAPPVAVEAAEVMEARLEEAALSMELRMDWMAEPEGRTDSMAEVTSPAMEVTSPAMELAREPSWAWATVAPTAATKTVEKRILMCGSGGLGVESVRCQLPTAKK